MFPPKRPVLLAVALKGGINNPLSIFLSDYPVLPQTYCVPTSNTSTRMTRIKRINTDFFLLRRKKSCYFGKFAEILHPNSAKQDNLCSSV